MAAWQAWTSAALMIPAFHKPKKFPRLDTVVPKKRNTHNRRQTWQQQKAIVMTMNAMYGGETRARDD